ncbi:sensor histidine kinase [Catenulispora subtropica]|uniref:histidine kinase n=1 Tax=Catenulispora subtropica TaxID=450798 RepID=A0ABP5CW12_9ACTN
MTVSAASTPNPTRSPPRITFAAASLYLIASTLLWVVGFAVTTFLLLVGVALSITPFGLWIIAAAISTARAFGRLYRGLVHKLFRTTLEPPADRTTSGILAWRRFLLSDGGSWMELAFLFIRVPLALLNLVVGVGLWIYGLLWTLWPLLRNWDDLYTRQPDGTVRRGLHPFGFWIDTLPRSFLVSVAGVLLISLAAWTARKLAELDMLFYRTIISPGRMSVRVRELERSRSYAVDDSAATLRRIERDLHDGAQARLVALGMQLVLLKDSLAGDSADADRLAHSRGLVDTAQQTAKTAIAELRVLVRGIHPPALDQGLEPALRTLAANGPIPTALTVDVPGPRPAPAIEAMAYFCVAELLTNAAKHASARQATVHVAVVGDRLHARVEDDGRGGARPRPGGGLAGLADRIGTVDGTVVIHSPDGGPTVVTVDLPTTP